MLEDIIEIVIKVVAITLVSCLFTYLFWGYALNQFNPFCWSQEARIWHIGITLLFALMVLGSSDL